MTSSLFFPILSLGAAVALFFVYLQPTYGKIGMAREEVMRLQSTLDSAREVEAARDRLVSKYNAIPPADLDRLKKILPDHIDTVHLILEVDKIASTYGMKLGGIAITEQGAESSSPTLPEGDIGAVAPGVVTFSFEVTSSYETFLQFLHDLEHSLRILDITALSFTPGGVEDSKKSNYYTFSVSLQTYWLPQ
jgi:Tfp pilus assembly protein PilO